MKQKEAKRVLVCGDRNWNLMSPIIRELKLCKSCEVVIHGACRGADLRGAEVAVKLGLETEAYPADWEKHGRAAGPIRNATMLVEGKPDFVLAFHENIKNSKGTADMIRRAHAAAIPVKVVTQ